jgi:hypothetical protein
MSHLRNALADYQTLRRALGYKMDKAERLLGQFTAFAEERGETHIRTETGWPGRPACGGGRDLASRRAAEVRLFATHLRALDQRTGTTCRPAARTTRRATPILHAAGVRPDAGDRDPARAACAGDLSDLIGLLAATGMRIGRRSASTATTLMQAAAW